MILVGRERIGDGFDIVSRLARRSDLVQTGKLKWNERVILDTVDFIDCHHQKRSTAKLVSSADRWHGDRIGKFAQSSAFSIYSWFSIRDSSAW